MPTTPRHHFQEAFPIEEAARIPTPGSSAPDGVAFSPDDSLLTFLYSPDRSLVNQLFAFDPQTGQRSLLVTSGDLNQGESSFSAAEALRRERLRQLSLGVTSYAWAREGQRLIIPLQGSLYGKEGRDGPLTKILDEASGSIQVPQLSPDGNWVAFVREDELFVVPFSGGGARQLTFGAREAGVTRGLAEFIAQEEMDRSQGFWWSPDSFSIAFTQVDESKIPVYRIAHQGKSSTGPQAQEEHAYPFAGQPNVRVRLGVVGLSGSEPSWLDLGSDPDFYLARVDWFPDSCLAVQIENRRQTRLELREFNLNLGTSRVLLAESSDTWINLHHLFYPFKNGSGFIWASERSGFRHLYLYTRAGNLVKALTEGSWVVDSLAGVNEDNGQVYFTASRRTPTESHLYGLEIAGSAIRQITTEPGMHTVVLDHQFKQFVDQFSSLEHPPRAILRSLTGGETLQVLYDEMDPRLQTIELLPPELVRLKNRQGDALYGSIYRPPASCGPGPYPTIVYTYGGPHVQLVSNHWRMTASMRAQYLRGLGFLVFVLDNRGSSRRGLAFEAPLKHNLGHPEVEDQVDGVHWLVAQGLADPQRVGIYGWSYGGYMALMCLARAGDTFKAAVAGAPVTAWDGYDTHYTERYMGVPQENPQAYKESSVISHAAKISGQLMIIHGLIDENVHFRHTARLVNALIQARVRYQLQLFPDERHSPRSLSDRVYMEENIRDFFLDALAIS